MNVRDEDDVMRRWVDRRRSSFSMSLEVLIGQLDRQSRTDVAKEKKQKKGCEETFEKER